MRTELRELQDLWSYFWLQVTASGLQNFTHQGFSVNEWMNEWMNENFINVSMYLAKHKKLAN